MQIVNKIGFFDSGLGGLSIWMECDKLLPEISTVYLADNNNAPYGIKSEKEIIDLSIKNTEVLLNEGCDIIVVACNTATTAAISHLRKTYDIPFVGIEPAIKPAALNSKNNRVGVLATEGTLVSSLFKSTSQKFTKGVHVINLHGTGLVELIEDGKMNSLEMMTLLNELLDPFIEEAIDYLVLGCTHYPFLRPQIQEILPDSITIIDSGEAVARRVRSLAIAGGFLGSSPKMKEIEDHYKGEKIFYTNKSKEIMDEFMKEIDIRHTCEFKEF
jgi:glutamate racemase